MAQDRVRFYVTVAGDRRELMSIVESANGDLTVNPRGFDNSFNEVPDVNDKRPVSERHISIHRSSRSQQGATTITGTMKVNGVEEQDFSALVINSRENLLWPVYSFLSPDVRALRYKPSKRKATRNVVLTETNPELSILIYHIMVLAPRREPPPVIQTTLSVVNFQFFKIAVYTHHLNLPSTPFSGGMYVPTRAPSIDKRPFHTDRPFVEQYPSGAEPMSDDDAVQLIMNHSFSLVANYAKFWEKAFPNGPNPLAYHRFRFSRFPIDF